MAQEVDQAELAAIRKELEQLHRRLFLQVKDRPPPKVGKPIVAAMKKLSDAVTLLGGEG